MSRRDRSLKDLRNFQYASSWAPPSDGEDEMDLMRDIHPALRTQQAPPAFSSKPRQLMSSYSSTTMSKSATVTSKGTTVNVRLDRSSKDMRNFDYVSSWAPPAGEEDGLDLSRDVHPALREDTRSATLPMSNARRTTVQSRPLSPLPPAVIPVRPLLARSETQLPPPQQQSQKLLNQYPNDGDADYFVYSTSPPPPQQKQHFQSESTKAYVSPLVARAAVGRQIGQQSNQKSLSANAQEFHPPAAAATTELNEMQLPSNGAIGFAYEDNNDQQQQQTIKLQQRKQSLLSTSWGCLELGDEGTRTISAAAAVVAADNHHQPVPPPGLSAPINRAVISAVSHSRQFSAGVLSRKQRGRPLCKINIDIPLLGNASNEVEQQQYQIDFCLHENDDPELVGKAFRFIFNGYEVVDSDQWEASLINYIHQVRQKLRA